MTQLVNTLEDDKTTRLYDISDIYDPDNPTGTGRYVPVVGSGVWINNELWKVTAVDPVTNKSTLVQVYSPGSDPSADGITSHRNDILRLMVNNTLTPIRALPDQSVRMWNGNARTYALYRYPGDNTKKTLISQYYNSSSQFLSNYVPMVPAGDSSTSYVCQACQLGADLTDDEDIGIAIFDESGAEMYYTVLRVKHSTIINDPMSIGKQVVSLTVKTAQMLDDGTSYLFEQQPISSLDVYGIVTYADGSTLKVLVDGRQTFLYGESDFNPAFTGMKQLMQLRYNFSANEMSSTGDTTVTAISTNFYVKVLSGKFSIPAKISVFPYFDQNTNGYLLRYYLYTTQNRMFDVTNFVTQIGTAFQPTNYVNPQSLTMSVDMSAIGDPDYVTPVVKTQNVVIKLSPVSAYVRWTISDSLSSAMTYGSDGPNQRRAILNYDSSKGVYFVPSSIFQNQAAFLESFYYCASPLYDSRAVSAPQTPTHFGIRNPYTGLLLSQTPITEYTGSITPSVNTDFTGGTVLVEFSIETSAGSTILYGVPVDVYAGTFVGTTN